MPLKKGMFIAGLAVLASILIWGYPPGGLEWIAIIIQVVVGVILISKSRVKASSVVQS